MDPGAAAMKGNTNSSRPGYRKSKSISQYPYSPTLWEGIQQFYKKLPGRHIINKLNRPEQGTSEHARPRMQRRVSNVKFGYHMAVGHAKGLSDKRSTTSTPHVIGSNASLSLMYY